MIHKGAITESCRVSHLIDNVYTFDTDHHVGMLYKGIYTYVECAGTGGELRSITALHGDISGCSGEFRNDSFACDIQL
jgi:hypothetical protein